jgi:hypothetical protein
LIDLSLALREGLAQTLAEMIRAGKKTPSEVLGFPSVKVSFFKPDGHVFKILKGKDLKTVALKEDQEIYVYQEA